MSAQTCHARLGPTLPAEPSPVDLLAAFALENRADFERFCADRGDARLAGWLADCRALPLIKAGASQQLARRLFGVNVHRYIALREWMGVKGRGVGRPASLDGQTAAEVLLAWQRREGMEEAERYLAVHRATGTPIRDIEAALRRPFPDGRAEADAFPAWRREEVDDLLESFSGCAAAG